MRPITLLLLVSAAISLPVSSWADKFDLGTHGDLEVAVPATWSAKSQSAGEQGFNIMIKPKSDANAGLQITALFMKVDQSISDEDMQKRFADSLVQMVPGSVEKKADLKKLKLKGATACYVSLTDESLVGKPSVPGNFKVMTSGMAKLSDGVVTSFTLFSDDKTGADFTEGLKIIESIVLNKK